MSQVPGFQLSNYCLHILCLEGLDSNSMVQEYMLLLAPHTILVSSGPTKAQTKTSESHAQDICAGKDRCQGPILGQFWSGSGWFWVSSGIIPDSSGKLWLGPDER